MFLFSNLQNAIFASTYLIFDQLLYQPKLNYHEEEDIQSFLHIS